jgi:hypothetical protein
LRNDSISGHGRASISSIRFADVPFRKVQRVGSNLPGRKIAMITVDVFYNLEIPEIGFICPFCKTLQCRIGGRMIDTQMYPNPKEVVAEHLKGRDRCIKFNPDLDSAEELQISAVNVTL